MLSAYVQAAMEQMRCERLSGCEECYCSIPDLPGVWATGQTKEEAQTELREVIEEWVRLGLERHQHIPVLAGIDLNATPGTNGTLAKLPR